MVAISRNRRLEAAKLHFTAEETDSWLLTPDS
jgi:hypothetical protein